ncbi:MAG: DUF4260 domain-containing protein [Bacillus sp. (in: firmicutes)]
MNKKLLHLEGAAVLGFSLYLYGFWELSWLLFILLLFVPDLSMIGYMFGNRTGVVMYNAFHTYLLPIIVMFLGVFLSYHIILAIGLIWLAHIGMDRMLGYGLKYPRDFKDTHLQRI